MQRVFEFGERVGPALSLVLWIAWVAGGAAAAWHSGKFLAPHRLATAVVLLIAVITGIGGLIGYWVVTDLVDFWRLGYRVKFVAGSEWLYEDARAAAPFGHFSLRATYWEMAVSYPVCKKKDVGSFLT